VLNQVKNLMIIHGIGELFDYARNIGAAGTRGYSLTKVPFYISMLSVTLLSLVLGSIGGFVFNRGMSAIYIARAIGMVVGALGIVSYWYHKSTEAIKMRVCLQETSMFQFFCSPCRFFYHSCCQHKETNQHLIPNPNQEQHNKINQHKALVLAMYRFLENLQKQSFSKKTWNDSIPWMQK